jgi:hypothetical protein
VKIGMSRAAAIRAAGRPRSSSRRALSWCVQGGGRTSAALSPGGRVRLIGTTARAKGPGRLGKGSSLRRARRVFGKPRRLGRAVYAARRRGPFVFGARRARLRYLAVAQRRLTRVRGRGQLGRSLRNVRLR